MRTTIKALTATALISLSFLSGSAVAETTTMDEAIRMSLESNPDIGIVASNREAINEELRQARGLYLPQVDVDLGVGPERTNNLTTRNAIGGSEDLVRAEATVNVVQRVFTGFETNSRIEREKARSAAAAERVYETSEFTALDAIGSYLEVIRQRQLVALARQNVAFHVDIIGKLQQRLNAGVGSTADVSQARARLARAQATLTQTANDLGDSEALYTRIVGQHPGELVLPQFPTESLPASIEEAVDKASTHNPTVRIRKADVEAADAEISIAEAEYYPDINIEGQSTYQEDADGIDTYQHQHSAMVRMRWNLFRGGIDRANRQEALMRRLEQTNRRRAAIVDAQQESRRSWFALEASAQRVEALREAVIHNQQTREAYEKQFNVGQRTLLDVLDAENELFTSRGQLVSAQINQLRSGYRLLASTGHLLTATGQQPARQANPESESFSDSIWFD